eukprot:jgi/Tetstr1/422526/TSEL_013336.t1
MFFPILSALLDYGGVGSTSDASQLQEPYVVSEADQRVVEEPDDEEELEIEQGSQTADELELGSQRPTVELTNEGADDDGQEEPVGQRSERDPYLYSARSRSQSSWAMACYRFQQLKSDPGAYVYWQGGQLICILVVYVDDMIFAFKDAVWAVDFKTAIGARFDIKDLGVCAWALGMVVEQDWDNAMR